jgi:O-antigen/teichoic acid export membrane protein
LKKVSSLFSNSFFKGVSSGYLLMLVNNLMSLWLIPYSLKFLSREEFSLYYIATDLMLWLGIVNLGTSSVFVTRVAQVLGGASDTKKEVLALVNTAFFVQCFFALIIFILGISASFFLPLFFETSQYTSDFQNTFFILSFSVGIALIGQVFTGLLVASKQIHVDNLIQIVLIIPRIGLTILLLHLGFGIIALAFVNLFVSVLGVAIPYIRVRRRLPHLTINLHFFERKRLKDFLGNGVWFSMGGIAGILILNMDRMVIGNFVGLALVSGFIITQKLYDIANKVVSQVVNVSRPYLASLFGRKDMKTLLSTYSALQALTILVSSFFATIIFLINKQFISLWVGESFFAGDDVNLFMALNFCLQAAVLPNRVLLASTFYKIRFHASIRFIEGAVNLSLSILLAQYMGMAGVVLASVITTVIFSNLMLGVLIHGFFRLNNVLVALSAYTCYLAILLPVTFFLFNRFNPLIDVLSSLFTLIILSLLYFYAVKQKKIYYFVYDKIFKKNM